MTAEVLSVPPDAVRGLRVREYEALVGTGVLDQEPLELIEGALVAKMPQLPAHAEALYLASLSLSAQLRPGWRLRTQLPLVASDRSEPEPDLAVVPDVSYRDHHPTSALLVVEVARSSLVIDLGVKVRVYAAAGVPDYWVLDVDAGRLHAHHGPGPEGYARVEVHERGVARTTGDPSLGLDVAAVLHR